MVWKVSVMIQIKFQTEKNKDCGWLSLFGSTQSMWTSTTIVMITKQPWFANSKDEELRMTMLPTTIFVNPLLRAIGALMDTSVCVWASTGSIVSRFAGGCVEARELDAGCHKGQPGPFAQCDTARELDAGATDCENMRTSSSSHTRTQLRKSQ